MFFCFFRSLIDTTYYVKVEYINVTDSNQPYPYVLPGCPSIECPLDIFSALFTSRFPSAAEIECAKKEPPSKFYILYQIKSHNLSISGDGGNKRLTAFLIIGGLLLGIAIIILFVWIYIRKRELDAPLLSSDAYTAMA